MNKEILILTDYKGFFGSKQKSPIYRGGMDIQRLSSIFTQNGFVVNVKQFSEIDIQKLKIEKPFIIYTSSEDKGDLYKSYIEDIILAFENAGLKVIPEFKYLKAHNNKVFMELLRENSSLNEIKTIHSYYFGTLEELIAKADQLTYPVVIKTHSGAMSRGVAKANSPEELIQKAKVVSQSSMFKHDLKDFLRKLKYKNNYIKESTHRSKFIIQNMIEGLENDWKVLVYGNKCYALFRGVRKGDFRASGSGDFKFKKEIPDGMLEYAYKIKEHFKVPNISIDVCYDGKNFHLIEFQFLYFGTTTIEKAPHYFELQNDKWELIQQLSDLEEVYASSITEYLKNE